MPKLVSSLEGTIARMGSQLGVRWPNPWWPTGVPAFDDCAAFVSWALWGLNGNQPYQTVVSGLVERSGFEFHTGRIGIRRGDLLGFRWTQDVNYSHIEVALGPADGHSNVRTIGANAGPGDSVAIRTRPTFYVHNFARPNYTALAGGPTTPIHDLSKEDDMRLALDPTRSTSKKNQYVVVGNGAPHDFTGDQALANYMVTVHGTTYAPTAAQWPAFIAAMTPPASASGSGAGVDLAPVLTALATLGQKGDANHAQLLAGIAGLPESVRARLAGALAS